MPATSQGTRSYFEKFKNQPAHFGTSVLGKTELTISRVGFGSYRVHEFEPEHREALKLSLLSGVNLIDTSTNYTDGSSERMIGDVTSELFASGQLKREQVVFVTKVGYVQGTTLREARERQGSSRAYPDMVEFQADCWHNLSPEFLADQITKSLERMKIDAIDILLLHNPEYYLKAGGSRDVYYARIEKAFRHLEQEVKNGRIKWYGVSSNTLPEAESRSDFTSLAKITEVANQVADPSHFGVVELPFNLYEAGAALHKNNQRLSVLEFAKKNSLGVLINRPFNAFAKGRLVRTTSFPTHDEVEVKGGLHQTLGRAIELEKKAPGYPKSAQGLQWAHAMREKLSEMDDVLAWRDALYQQIIPSVRQALQKLPGDQTAWAQEYQSALQELFKLVTHDLENLANQKSNLLGEQLQTVATPLGQSPTLSRKVMRIYHAFPQVDCVLVGMRQTGYVNDVLGTEQPLGQEAALETLLRFQRYRS